MKKLTLTLVFFIIIHFTYAQVINVEINAILEGAYDEFDMKTDLNSAGLIPLSQPYNKAPWYYEGTESVIELPNSDVVDWVLVELRETKWDSLPTTREDVIGEQAAFLLRDGSIVSLDGESSLVFNIEVTDHLYAVLWHRNHLAIMSAGPLAESNGTYICNFTTNPNLIYGGSLAVKDLGGGVYGMMGGDGDYDGQIANQDKNEIWVPQNGNTGYNDGDFNLNGEVENQDMSDVWDENVGTGITVPGGFNCGDRLIDERNGQKYKTVKLGTNCWMAENLNIGTTITGISEQTENGILEKYCYNNQETNCEIYGALYQWNEIMNYDTSQYVNGICPEGWQFPTEAEWNDLIDEFGGHEIAGDSLKTDGNSGFNALMAGIRRSDGSFSNFSSNGYFWKSTQSDYTNATYNYLTMTGNGIYGIDTLKNMGLSVRCIKGERPIVDSNVIIIDTLVYTLISDSLQLAQGIYVYGVNQTKMKSKDIITDKDIIIGETDEGYLRKVVGLVQNNDTLSIQTAFANMEDLFQSGEFSFETDLGNTVSAKASQCKTKILYLAKGVTMGVAEDGGFQYDFSNVSLYNSGPIALSITNGHVIFEPNFKFDFKFKNHTVKKLGFYTENALLETDINVDLTVSQAVQLMNYEKLLASYMKIAIYPTPSIIPIPILVVTKIKLKAISTLNLDASFNATTGYTNTNMLDIGCKYENGSWSKIFDLNTSNNFHPLNMGGMVNLSQDIRLVPEIRFTFYGVAGPYINTALYEHFSGNIAPPSLDWDATLDIGLTSNIGADITIFGKTLAHYNKPIDGFNHNIWNAPNELLMISGNNQVGDSNQVLQNPIKVKVTDNYGNTFANIPVHFEITEGGGSLSNSNVMTDANGNAEVFWTLGPISGDNKLEVKVIKANGGNILGSPMEFIATTAEIGCPGLPYITYGGQTYSTVQIGSQCWLRENLNYYTPSSSCYNNNATNCITYGRLYTWQEAKIVCPSGWHLPEEDEWDQLINFLGGSGVAGGKLKEQETIHWNPPNTGATNESGFTALPGGVYWGYAYSFANLGVSGFFWTNTEDNTTHAKSKWLFYNNDGVISASNSYYNLYDKISVRCLKD